MKNKKGAAPKQAVKEASKKAKRLKFQRSMSTSDAIHSQQSAEPAFQPRSTQPPAANLQELSERLKAKLAAMREKRGGVAKPKNVHEKGDHKKSKRQRKNKNKRKRKEMAGEEEEDDEGEGAREQSKAKLQSRLDDSELKEQQSKLSSKLAASMKSTTLRKEKSPSSSVDANPGGISFGRLKVDGKVVLGDGGTVEGEKKVGGKRNLLNVKQMLEKAEKNRERIAQLKRSKDETIRAQGDAEKWAQMEALAAGSVDPKQSDPRMLKKRLKRLEKAKAKRTQKWKERSQKTKMAIKEKQDKRRENLKAQQDKKLENRLKKKGIVVEQSSTAASTSKTNSASNGPKDGKDGGKRKRRRPGFEGKHGGFLNAKKRHKGDNGGPGSTKFQGNQGNGKLHAAKGKGKGEKTKVKRKKK